MLLVVGEVEDHFLGRHIYGYLGAELKVLLKSIVVIEFGVYLPGSAVTRVIWSWKERYQRYPSPIVIW
jgi:hypothetical protein